MPGQAVGIDKRNIGHGLGDSCLRLAYFSQISKSGRSRVDQADDKLHPRLVQVGANIGNHSRQIALILRCCPLVSAVALALHPETAEQIDIFSRCDLLDMTDQAGVKGAFVSVICNCCALGGPFALPGQQRRTADGVLDQP